MLMLFPKRITSLLLTTSFALILLQTSCTHAPKSIEKEPNLADAESALLDVDPNIDRPTREIFGKDVETIAIFGTNDIHGNLAPLELKSREADGVTPQNYQAGGVATLASYVNIVRQEFGAAFLWLDAGDEFQGSIESNLAQGAPMVDFFNTSRLNAAAVGNHEFDYGPDSSATGESTDRLGALKSRIRQAKYPYLSANIFDKSSQQFASHLLPGLNDRALLQIGRVKVGVVGLSTTETPRTTSAVNIRSLEFKELRDITLNQATKLRQEGADVVVLVAHVGLKCERGRASPAHHIRKPADPIGECGKKDEMVQLLKALPTGTIDAVVAGHSHQVVHHWIEGVPVVQGGAYGRYFNIIYLSFDLKAHKVLPQLTRIEGPVPVCTQVFKNQHDCNGDRNAPKSGRGALVAANFHGKPIGVDPIIQKQLEPVIARSAEKKKEFIAEAARPIDHDRFHESPLGNFVADALRKAVNADTALMNSGGIRSNLEQGAITYGDIFRVLPFDNTVVKLTVTGKELKILFRVAESGSKGFPPISGLRVNLLHAEANAPSTDLNGDGKLEAWEANRLLEITMQDGTPIDDQKNYTVATLDFLRTGGDDLGYPMSIIPDSRVDTSAILVRDAAIHHLKDLSKLGPIHSVAASLIDPLHPRMRFEKPQAPAKKGKARGKRKNRSKRSKTHSA